MKSPRRSKTGSSREALRAFSRDLFRSMSALQDEADLLGALPTSEIRVRGGAHVMPSEREVQRARQLAMGITTLIGQHSHVVQAHAVGLVMFGVAQEVLPPVVLPIEESEECMFLSSLVLLSLGSVMLGRQGIASMADRSDTNDMDEMVSVDIDPMHGENETEDEASDVDWDEAVPAIDIDDDDDGNYGDDDGNYDGNYGDDDGDGDDVESQEGVLASVEDERVAVAAETARPSSRAMPAPPSPVDSERTAQGAAPQPVSDDLASYTGLQLEQARKHLRARYPDHDIISVVDSDQPLQAVSRGICVPFRDGIVSRAPVIG